MVKDIGALVMLGVSTRVLIPSGAGFFLSFLFRLSFSSVVSAKLQITHSMDVK